MKNSHSIISQRNELPLYTNGMIAFISVTTELRMLRIVLSLKLTSIISEWTMDLHGNKYDPRYSDTLEGSEAVL